AKLVGEVSRPNNCRSIMSPIRRLYVDVGYSAFTIPAAETPNDQWHTFAVEWEIGRPLVVYINGARHSPSTALSTTTFSQPQPSIGHTAGKSSLGGELSHVHFFDRPLTDNERQYILDNLDAPWSALNEVDGEVVVGHEPTTNLFTNPPVANNSHWWSSYVGGTENSLTSERVTTQPDMGAACFETALGTYDGSSAVEVQFYGNVGQTQGQPRTFTASALVKASRPLMTRLYTRISYTDGFENYNTTQTILL